MSNDDLPPGWTHVTLADCADSQLGKMLDAAKHTSGTRLAYLRNINVRWGAFDLTDLLLMYFEDDELARFGLRNGDVLVCEGGEPGRAAVWRRDGSEIKFQKALHRVRPTEALLSDWLVYSLKFDATRGGLVDLFTGTTIKHLTGASLAKYSLRLPPVSEQSRIVAKLEALQARADAAKEALDAVPALLERFRQSVLAAAFRGDLTRSWREANPDVEPASELFARIRAERRRKWEEANPRKPYVEPETDIASTQRELPEGWQWVAVESLCWEGPTNGYSGPTDGTASGTLTMKLSATTSGELVLNALTTKRLAEVVAADSKYWLQGGDILVQRANSLEYLGATAIFASWPEPIVYPDLMMRLRVTEPTIGRLIWRYFNSLECRSYFRASATGTAGNMPKINGQVLRATLMPLPPFAEANEMLTLVDRAMELVDSVGEKQATMRALASDVNQSILAKAFRGELVPQDPNDEPASVLLERIRAERAAAPTTPRRGRKPASRG